MNDLYLLVTISEASKLFHRGRGTIRYHMDKGRLDFRKTPGRNGVYLITYSSLKNLFLDHKIARH